MMRVVRRASVQIATARMLAPRRVRDRAAIHGELFILTDAFTAGWPTRYLPEFTEGEEAARSWLWEVLGA